MGKEFVCFGEMFAAEKAAVGRKGRRVGRFQNKVRGVGNKLLLLPCGGAPEKEYHRLFSFVKLFYNRVGELLPADIAVAHRAVLAHGKNGIEQKHALLCPGGKVARFGDSYTNIVT